MVVAARARRFWLDLSLRRKGLLVVSLPLLALVLTAALAFRAQRAENDAEAWVRSTRQAAAELRTLDHHLVDAQAAVHAYPLTRDRAALVRYDDAVKGIAASLGRLDPLLADPAQRAELDRIARLAGTQIFGPLVPATEAEEPVRVPPARLAQSSQAVTAIRDRVERMQRGMDELLADRSVRATAARRSTLLVTLVGALAGVTGGLIGALLFVTGISRCVDRLALSADQLAAGEPLDLIESRGDELGHLEQRLQEVAALLRSRDEEIRGNVEQLKSAAAELQARMQQVSAANEELEAFSYSVSHDLRAPLRHVAGFAALLMKSSDERLDDQSRRYLANITTAATRMGHLIDDLLAFSRMARAEMAVSAVDLGALVRDVQREVLGDAGGHKVHWRVGPLPAVRGDPAMLRVAFANLLSNALKYSSHREDPVIEIGAWESPGDEQVVFVRDNGVGFDMKYAGKLFGVFQRLHTADEFEGTGIGLAIVRRIVGRHGGRVWAEGEVHRGAAFYVSLPRRGVPL
jgi:signal transduction histidine kinase